MKFFVPLTADEAETESIYESLREFVDAPDQVRRICKLEWRHNGHGMVCEVGKPMPDYYELGAEPVLAIFDAGNCYLISTPSRGGVRGIPIIATHGAGASPTYFDP